MAKAPPLSAIAEWGVPDPRDAAAYLPVAGTRPSQWAWQFLRRRDDYRRRWQQLNREHGHHDVLDNDGTRRSVSRTEADAAITADKTVEWRSPQEVLRVEFRVYPSPENQTLDLRESCAPFFGAIYQIRSISEVELPQVGILFDVSLPLPAQIEATRKLLTQLATEQPSQRPKRPQVDKLPRYLRLLDFQAVGAPDSEIGKHLFPNAKGERLRDLIRDSFDQAQHWQRDYLLIALRPSAHS